MIKFIYYFLILVSISTLSLNFGHLKEGFLFKQARAADGNYTCTVGYLGGNFQPGNSYTVVWEWSFEPSIPETGGGSAFFHIGSSVPSSGINSTFEPSSAPNYPGSNNVWSFTIPANTPPGNYNFPVNVDVSADWSGNLDCGTILVIVEGPTQYFSLSCTPGTTTITQGSSTSYALNTTAQNGFNSAVTFSSSITPSSGTLPQVSFTNNGAVPSATTTAVITTSSSTTPGTYTYTFTGDGGGQSHQCQTQLVVNALPRSLSFTVTPIPSGTTGVMKGNNAQFNVQANCTGTFTSPVSSLAASSPFTGLTYTFSSPSVACGSSVTLTISNTGSLPPNELSTPQNINPKTITVTGSAN
jgi:hypothetical protein